MSTGWVAAGVRGRGLLRRRLGPEGVMQVATAPSLHDALGVLAETSYGREVRTGQDLATAQHGVSATALWHLRVLAGWGPPLGAGPLRLMAGGYEISDVTGRLLELAGAPTRPPYALGSLATAWPALAATRSAPEMRAALRASPWGDPGSDELAVIRVALQLAWARRIVDGVPGATDWAIAGAALLVGRVLAAGADTAFGQTAWRDATHVLGPDWQKASDVDELAEHVPPAAAKALEDVASPDDLWRAEARWWGRVETEAALLAARPRPDPTTGVGVAALLIADAWRVRAALGLAGRGGRVPAEVLGDVA
jgi:hypothetical protein